VDASGSSEWFVLSAVVIRADREPEVIHKVKQLRSVLEGVIRPEIHFRFLRSDYKRIVCQEIAQMHLRCFVVMSNKKNMRGYVNKRAQRIFGRNTFYNWMIRLLLERVTRFCHDRTQKDFKELRTLRIEFSHRGGHSYGQTKAYLSYIKGQSQADALWIKEGDIVWPLINIEEIYSFDGRQRAGLQLADCVASAFYEAVSLNKSGQCSPEFAKLLKPRIWRNNGTYIRNGLLVLPWKIRAANLEPAQREIFEFYGVDPREW
jgi:hypothetical protein